MKYVAIVAVVLGLLHEYNRGERLWKTAEIWLGHAIISMNKSEYKMPRRIQRCCFQIYMIYGLYI
jgi:hypothetical protein